MLNLEVYEGFTCKGHCRRGYLNQQLSQRVAISTLPENIHEMQKHAKPLR